MRFLLLKSASQKVTISLVRKMKAEIVIKLFFNVGYSNHVSTTAPSTPVVVKTESNTAIITQRRNDINPMLKHYQTPVKWHSCKQQIAHKLAETAYTINFQPLDIRSSAAESNLHEVASILYIDTAKL